MPVLDLGAFQHPMHYTRPALGIYHDIASTLAYLRIQGFEDNAIAVVGFCMGGSVVVTVAAEYALGAAATFYGSGIAAGRFGSPSYLELAPEFKTPWPALAHQTCLALNRLTRRQVGDLMPADGGNSELVLKEFADAANSTGNPGGRHGERGAPVPLLCGCCID